jgi:general secretion pathway protein G
MGARALRRDDFSSPAGFSLTEILIVIAVVGVIAAIAIPGYINSLEQARIARAVADIRVIEADIRAYRSLNDAWPTRLSDVRRGPTRDPWGNDYVYTDLSGLKGKGKARKDRFLNPLNSDFDLYSLGRDGRSSTPLTAKASQDDIVRASDGGFIGLAADF